MKIIVPTVAVETVGFRTIMPTRHYYYGDRRNVLPPVRHEDIREYRLTTRVAFDRDLRVAARAKAVGRMVLLSAFLAASIPLAVVFVAGEQVGKAIEFSIGLMGRGLNRAGVSTFWGIRRQYAELAREVVR